MRCFILLFLTAFASAVTGTYTQYTATWKGFTRYYAVYVPQLQSGSMVLFLHATSSWRSIPYSHVSAWEQVSDQGGFIMIWPISTFDPSGQPGPTWHWECDGCSSGFPATPDDSGFLRWLITSLQSQYSISPGKTFVAGMSSGGFMTHRVGMELSDLIAAIAPVSGMQYIQPSGTTFVAPLVPNPVSVYELHGDLDRDVPYCGGARSYWSVRAFSPSTDSDVSFWDGPNANNCTAFSQSQPLCTAAGHPTRNVNGQDATGCLGGVEVVFERELGEGHTWPAGTEAKIWAFFQAHSR